MNLSSLALPIGLGTSMLTGSNAFQNPATAGISSQSGAAASMPAANVGAPANAGPSVPNQNLSSMVQALLAQNALTGKGGASGSMAQPSIPMPQPRPPSAPQDPYSGGGSPVPYVDPAMNALFMNPPTLSA